MTIRMPLTGPLSAAARRFAATTAIVSLVATPTLAHLGPQRTVERPGTGNPNAQQAEIWVSEAERQQQLSQEDVLKKADALKGDVTINGVQLSRPTVGGLVLIRDVYANQLNHFLRVVFKAEKLSDPDKVRRITKLLPAVRQAKLWKKLRDSFRGSSLASWREDFATARAAALKSGDKGTADLIDQASNIGKGRAAAEAFMLQQYYKAVDSDPLVAALADAISDDATGSPSGYLDEFNTGLEEAFRKAALERSRVMGIDTVEGMAEFLRPQYRRLWGPAANLFGRYSQVLVGRFEQLSESLLGLQALDDQQKDYGLFLGVMGLAVISIFVPPLALAFGMKALAGAVVVGGATGSLVASGTQLVWDGEKYWTLSTQAQNAAGGQSVFGAQTVLELNEQATEALKQVVVDGLMVGADLAGLAIAIKEAKGISMAAATEEAVNLARAARGEMVLADSEKIIRRLPSQHQNFFRSSGLHPARTIKAGGRTYHLSAPYQSGSRTAVVAFEEVADGSVIPRTFYISNEHGVWKSALGYTPGPSGGLIHKGPLKAVVRDTTTGAVVADYREGMQLSRNQIVDSAFVNEAAADVATDLQGQLFDHLANNGVRQLDEGPATMAFRGFLDETEESQAMFAAAHGGDSTPALTKRFEYTLDNRPRIEDGPVRRWTFDHPLYGRTEGFVYASRDGKLDYIVYRAEKDNVVRVWVPSIQESGAEVTQFGTRTTAIRDEVTNTPGRHVRRNQYGDATEGNVPFLDKGDDPEYVDVRQDTVNPLTNFFRDRLPPRPVDLPAGATQPVPRANPAIGSAGRRGAVAAITGATAINANAQNDWPPPGASAGRRRPQESVVNKEPVPETELEKAAKMFEDLIFVPAAADVSNIPEKTGWTTLDTAEAIEGVLEKELFDNGVLGYQEWRTVRHGTEKTVTLLNVRTGQKMTARAQFDRHHPAAPNDPDLDIYKVVIDKGNSTFTAPAPIDPAPTPPNTPAPVPSGKLRVDPSTGGTSGYPTLKFNDPAAEFTPMSTPGFYNVGPDGSLGNDLAPSFSGVGVNSGVQLIITVGDGSKIELNVPAVGMIDEFEAPAPEASGLLTRVLGWLRPTPAWRATSAARFTAAPATSARSSTATSQRSATSPPVSLSIAATGASTGAVFKVSAINRTGRPVTIAAPEGLVLEAIRRQAEPPSPIPAGAGGRRSSLEGYCLEFLKPPPSASALYRVASPATQQRFAPLVNVLRTAAKLAADGRLHPDSDLKGYLQFVKQYALWTKLQNWDLKKFSDAFLDRTKKNFQALGQAWTREVERQVVAAIPGRWRDVQAVIQARD